ncbi:MAG: imidazole glycerol phosphate synthase subunit HisH [Bryobacterales bacterium]|nr:imidazole glycerol phosphate synthase subunit HisH [Bryobacterales bacterium]MBV9397028.1 imidazole glycerol phosphate synthase subunit HisH [Bryobacterales bacterium]
MISIFDYGAGNLQSVKNTLGALGAPYELIRNAGGLRGATKIILPGVGHFGQMMRALDELRVRDALVERIQAGVPFMGICLGLQALFTSSEEAPAERGLGIYAGEVKRFRGDLRIPHMGWDEVRPCRETRLLRGTDDRVSSCAKYFYFANSYYCPIVAATAAVCDYIVPFTAVLEQANVYGVQFHPEKSGPSGLAVVKNFIEAC